MIKTSLTSHHLLTSHCQQSAIGLRRERRRRESVRGLHSYIVSLALAVLWVALSPAPALATPGPRQTGRYDITVSGYYRGTGTANANPAGVSIDANVKDDAGKAHKLTAARLARDQDRNYLFSGRGSLDGMGGLVDGRVRAPG